MKQKRNIITMDEYGRIHFLSTTNNDIWMNTNELIELCCPFHFRRKNPSLKGT